MKRRFRSLRGSGAKRPQQPERLPGIIALRPAGDQDELPKFWSLSVIALQQNRSTACFVRFSDPSPVPVETILALTVSWAHLGEVEHAQFLEGSRGFGQA